MNTQTDAEHQLPPRTEFQVQYFSKHVNGGMHWFNRGRVWSTQERARAFADELAASTGREVRIVRETTLRDVLP